MTLQPPLSKSDAQRALVLADVLGIAFDEVLPSGEVLPRDVEVLRDGLVALRAPTAHIDCHDGGAPFRFLLTQAVVLGRTVEFTGTERLGVRPHGPLLQTLRAVPGVRITQGAPWPMRVESSIDPCAALTFVVSGEESSQFASSLLLGAARLAKAGAQVCVRVEGALTSEGYYALTRTWLSRCGFTLLDEAGRTTVLAPSSPSRIPEIRGDWSSLGYLLALSWASGVPVGRLAFGTGHPDEAVVGLLQTIGLSVGAQVRGTPTGGFEADAAVCPDSIPTLAVWATVLPAPSSFVRVGILRLKESDRLEAVGALLDAAGLRTHLEGDTLTVHPGAARPFRFDARGDHRMAMAAAVLARLHQVKLTLRGMECVNKSFPGFWAEASKANVLVEAWT